MKKQRKQNTKRLQRKHARAVARKNKGAQYGASVKAFNKLGPLMQERIEQVVVQGTDSREVLSDSFVDTNKKGPHVGTIKTGVGSDSRETLSDTFTQDPTQTLKDKMAKADKGTIDIS